MLIQDTLFFNICRSNKCYQFKKIIITIFKCTNMKDFAELYIWKSD